MSAFTALARSAAGTFSKQQKSAGSNSIAAGQPIGLLLALTYAAASITDVAWTNQAKS